MYVLFFLYDCLRHATFSGTSSVLTEDETILERVRRVNPVLVLPTEPGGARHLRHNGLVRPVLGHLCHPHGHRGAEDALDHQRLAARLDVAPRVVQSAPRRHARARGGPVHLAVRKDAHVPAVRRRVVRGAHEDDAVQEGEVLLEGVGDGELICLCHHCVLDRFARRDVVVVRSLGERGEVRDLREGGGVHRVVDVDYGIEGAAVRDVEFDVTEALDLHSLVAVRRERGHVQERRGLDDLRVLLREVCRGPDQARRCVDAQRRLVVGHQAHLVGELREGDDGVPAHGAVALVVHKEGAKVAALRGSLAQDGAVHVGVPTRLEHQRRPQLVVLLPEVPPALQDRAAGHGGHSAHRNAQRLASRVHLHRRHAGPASRRLQLLRRNRREGGHFFCG
eukprot:Rhum_TRINITY_DN23087_c0_g1::Rhum_TRINITY_DN23087_c0_g1_i1::g.177067::m.177067